MLLRILVPFLAICSYAASSANAGTKPNFVLIMTDDQDLHLNSLEYQPVVQEQFREKGTFFQKHFCTMAQCCPSRVSFLTGKAGHNTNVTDIQPPFGGYPKFIQEGLNENYLPVWLQEAGYNTYYTGKLMNSHSTSNYNNPFPAGWNGSDFLLDPMTYMYNNATMQRNREPPRSYPGNYSTDLITSKALGFLEEAAAAPGPFFIAVMPIGPHTQTIFPTGSNALPIFEPPVPAERHKDLFPNVTIPRNANFNPDIPSGASYVTKLPQWNESVTAYNDEFYRLRLRALQAVDDLVHAMISRLEALDVLSNTYVIYTTDNGFHMGQHRLPPGKSCPYEEDVNIPFFIRGPGIPANQVIQSPTSHTDLAPTFFQLAGIPLRDDFDGHPIPIPYPSMDGFNHNTFRAKSEHINIEFWGRNLGEGTAVHLLPYSNNTYKALRVVSKAYDLSYVVWCTNEHELYNMQNDPFQMANLLGESGDQASKTLSVAGRNMTALVPRLDALMMVLKSCKGQVCVRPWDVLHPDGQVDNLADALNPKYDAFYSAQPAVMFEECALGYFPELEGPQEPLIYLGPGKYDYMAGSHWSDWT